MKKIVSLMFLLTNLLFKSQETDINWNSKMERRHLEKIEDSLAWDYENFKRDLGDKSKFAPFDYGVFPAPKYELLGYKSFTGVGCGTDVIEIDKERKYVYSFLLNSKNRINQKYLKENTNEVFFLIITVSDISKEVDNSNVQITSRNNPHILGQGTIENKNSKISFSAFITADRDQFAIVNLRLFNLSYGNIILIAPQKDGSLRSKQIKSKKLIQVQEVDALVKKITNENYSKKFFNL